MTRTEKDLRLVPEGGGRARRRRTRLVTTLVALAAAVGLFAIVCLHVLLSQGQMSLDRLESQAGTLQSQNERLRVTVAELESPNRIVALARGRLGMAPPAAVVPLAPAAGGQSGPAASGSAVAATAASPAR